METCAKRLRIPAISLILAACVLLPASDAVKAGYPPGAYYSADTDKVFWFIHASDTHIGADGTLDADRLRWLVTTARSVITPAFVVVTGDITDSTNANWLGWPNGPHQEEWNEYNAILAGTGVNAGNYYDLPGNHDAYNDRYFTYYLANSVQGRATGRLQQSWTYLLGPLKYHFLGVNSADNSGDSFSLLWPYGDNAGLDTDELSYIDTELNANADAELTFVFGHHPIVDTGVSTDTWLFYGRNEFITALDAHGGSTYNYGHTHRNSEALFIGTQDVAMPNGSGYDLVRAVRENQRTATMPVIAITAYNRPEDRQRALAEGFDAHVGKPFDPRALVGMIASMAR